MDIFCLTIDGIPVAKGRPRFTRAGGFARTYTPQKTRDAEGMIEWLAINEMKSSNKKIITNAVIVSIDFLMPIPKSFSKTKQLECLQFKIVPTVKPDLDNLAKTVLDAMNGIVYKDDSQIIQLHLRKGYAEKPCTVVSIKEYENKGNYWL
jgi:Holliday junction resolvase RusA-like endonuclease